MIIRLKMFLSALLQLSFRDELDVKSYFEIKDSKESAVDMSGRTRLFVPQGKRNKLSNKKLVDIISKKSGISSRKIKDVQVFDTFSFVTLLFNEAEQVLSFF